MGRRDVSWENHPPAPARYVLAGVGSPPRGASEKARSLRCRLQTMITDQSDRWMNRGRNRDRDRDRFPFWLAQALMDRSNFAAEL